MKKLTKIFIFFTITLMFSCSQDEVNGQNNENLINVTTKSNEPVPDITFTVESDMVGVVSPGCYTVNVRVYSTGANGDTWLIANENVNVGDCENRTNKSNSNSCQGGYLKNGDYVFGNKTSNKECLFDLLKRKEIFKQYINSTNKLLGLNRKG